MLGGDLGDSGWHPLHRRWRETWRARRSWRSRFTGLCPLSVRSFLDHRRLLLAAVYSTNSRSHQSLEHRRFRTRGERTL